MITDNISLLIMNFRTVYPPFFYYRGLISGAKIHFWDFMSQRAKEQTQKITFFSTKYQKAHKIRTAAYQNPALFLAGAAL